MTAAPVSMGDAPWAAIVIGASAGGHTALSAMLGRLPADYPLPILVACHLHPADRGLLARHLGTELALSVIEAEDKEPIMASRLYLAPAGYHLLVERDHTLALSIDERVNWARPAIDVLFDSAARVWRERLVAIVLSGANVDGTAGAATVKALGGRVLVQDPASAEQPTMPQAVIDKGIADHVLPPAALGKHLLHLNNPPHPTLGRLCP